MSAVTRSPTFHSVTALPTESITPANSWPFTRGNLARKLPSWMVRSVLQMPQALTRMTTWWGPGSGLGRSTTANCRGAVY